MALDEVRVTLEGLMLEPLLDRALGNGARMWNLRRTGPRAVTLCTTSEDAARLLVFAERAGVLMTIGGLRGVPRLSRRLRARWQMAVAMALCCAILALLPTRIWGIEVSMIAGEGESVAADDVRSAQVLDALSSGGLRPGAAKALVDTGRLTLHLESALPGVAFVSVKLRGSLLQITLREESAPPRIRSLNTHGDVIASRDAVVTAVRVFSGTAMVKPGDIVRKGELLIRGEERGPRDSTNRVTASGEVSARVWATGEASMALKHATREYTGAEGFESELNFLDFHWPLLSGPEYALYDEYPSELPIGGLFLPVKILRRNLREQRTVTRTLTEAEAQETTGALAMEQALAKYPPGCEIVDKWVDYGMIEGNYVRALAVVEYIQDIALAPVEPGDTDTQ